MKPLSGLLGFLAVVCIVFVANAFFVVDETNQAVVTQFGKPVGEPIRDAGLHFKTPFIQKVNYFDKRILEWDGYPTEVPTKDKKFIWVDTTGRWQIKDPLVFMKSMRTELKAQSRLDDILDGVTRDLLTQHNLVEIVRNTNRIMDVTEERDDAALAREYQKIDAGRNEITRAILERARPIVSKYGIDLVDLRLKRINYLERVRLKVYDRMISERNRAAEILRSEGQGHRAEIEGQKERELKKIQSEAYRTVQEIKGKADAEAVRIYAAAYSKDPEFYAFTRTLELYPETLKGSIFIMSTDADYLKHLKGKGENPLLAA